MLFVGEHNDKGEVLVEFLRALSALPARVVYVDDKAKHVRAVDAALARAAIECLAFRYGGADADVARFDVAEADRTLDRLGL